MKLNHDLIRNLLFYLEDNTSYDVTLKAHEVAKEFTTLHSEYDKSTILYHLNQLYLAGYITEFTKHNTSEYMNYWYTSVGDLTPKGHEYLQNIRNESIWNKIKTSGIELNKISLDTLFELAKELGLSYAKKKLGLE